ncbi:ankyrin repeat domain-containing protein [Salininema proteolyticum]|uniref:Ankyrin repeat domain-containing protein n=1 Tax=Salininema proteolyticum TaxID=1607685 RepID=A0ABV8TUL6_9ACTN
MTAIADRAFDLARTGETAVLEQYLDAGLPIEIATGSGDTLLMLAAYNGHADTVRALIRRGADVDRLNDRGQSPLAGAVFKDYREVITVLLGHGADPEAGSPNAREIAGMFQREVEL